MTDPILQHISDQYDTIDLNCVAHYRETFLRDDATKWVLGDILNFLYAYHQTMSTAEEALIHNFATLILAKLGMHAPEHVERGYIVEALSKMPPVPWVKKDDEKETK